MECHFASDSDIVDALRTGDAKRKECACRTLYVGVGRSIRRWYVAKGATLAQADDWVQETFLKMLRSLDQYRGDSRFTAWLWMIARNVRIDALRGKQRHLRVVPLDEGLPGEDEPMEFDIPDPNASPFEDAVKRQYLECVDQAFQAFARDFPERAEVLGWVVDGLSIGDMASRRRKSAGAMREDLSQTRKKIRAYSAHCAEP